MSRGSPRRRSARPPSAAARRWAPRGWISSTPTSRIHLCLWPTPSRRSPASWPRTRSACWESATTGRGGSSARATWPRRPACPATRSCSTTTATCSPGPTFPAGLSGDLLSYLRADPALTAVAYSPLLRGSYVRADKPLDAAFDHAGTPTRLAALGAVADETGATANQVVLAWLMGGEVPIIPLVGASSVAQLEESLAAADLELTADQRAALDTAH
jgi:hypothetical protein